MTINEIHHYDHHYRPIKFSSINDLPNSRSISISFWKHWTFTNIHSLLWELPPKPTTQGTACDHPVILHEVQPKRQKIFRWCPLWVLECQYICQFFSHNAKSFNYGGIRFIVQGGPCCYWPQISYQRIFTYYSIICKGTRTYTYFIDNIS